MLPVVMCSAIAASRVMHVSFGAAGTMPRSVSRISFCRAYRASSEQRIAADRGPLAGVAQVVLPVLRLEVGLLAVEVLGLGELAGDANPECYCALHWVSLWLNTGRSGNP
jgi:hypothetical protein